MSQWWGYEFQTDLSSTPQFYTSLVTSTCIMSDVMTQQCNPLHWVWGLGLTGRHMISHFNWRSTGLSKWANTLFSICDRYRATCQAIWPLYISLNMATNMLMMSKYMVIPNQRKLHALFSRLLSASVRLLLESSNLLHLNSGKTDGFTDMVQYWLKRHLIPTTPLHLNGADVVPSETVRNLGAYLDSGLTMDEHAKRVLCNTSYSQRSKAIHSLHQLHYQVMKLR